MSMHKIPLTPLEEEGLRLHGLPIGTPNQRSDTFRQGMAWAIKSAPNPPQSLSSWQPIATAPKDGSAVMLKNEHGGVIVALFRDAYPSGFRPDSPWQSLMLNHNYLPSAMRFGAPTNWMPLPEPTP